MEDNLPPPHPERLCKTAAGENRREVLDTLPPREARILRLRFGLENGHNYTLEKWALKFGINARTHPPM